MGGSEMAQRANALATKPTYLSLIIGTHTLEGENILLSSLHIGAIACMHVCAHIQSHVYKTMNE